MPLATKNTVCRGQNGVFLPLAVFYKGIILPSDSPLKAILSGANFKMVFDDAKIDIGVSGHGE